MERERKGEKEREEERRKEREGERGRERAALAHSRSPAGTYSRNGPLRTAHQVSWYEVSDRACRGTLLIRNSLPLGASWWSYGGGAVSYE